MRGWKRGREREKKRGGERKCVCLAKMRQNERTQGAVHWGRNGTDGITMYRSPSPSWDTINLFSSPLKGKKKKKKKFHTTYPSAPPPRSSTPFLLQPPAAPSHSSYEPRAGRSEYNFLYCVNVRTYVWIRKMFILRNVGLLHLLQSPE